MGKYSDRLLGNKTESAVLGKYSGRLLGGGLSAEKQQPEYVENPYMQDTGAISTITAKPVQEPSKNGWYKPADMKTLMQASFVDDNEAKKQLFAEKRGIPVENYTVKDGKFWFKGEDGKYYPETPQEISNVLKKFMSDMPADLLVGVPSAVGAAGGSVAGPGGTVAGGAGGAALGELSRKEIGRIFFGDKQDVSDYMIDMAGQAVLGGIDAKLGKVFSNMLNRRQIKKATGGKLTNALSDEVADISAKQRIDGQIVTNKGKDIGVDLLPHQAMDDPALSGYYSLLRDNPKTARQVRMNDDKLDQQVQKAGEDLIKKISDRETDPFEVGQELSDIGTAAIEKMKAVRAKAVKPLYDEANKVVDVDVTPVLNDISDLKSKVKPGMKAHSALNKIETMLLEKKGDKMVPESRLEIIDNVKQEIDAILAGPDGNAINNKLKRKMMEIKETLTTQSDLASKDYAIARALHGAASEKITRAERGILGTLSRMQTDDAKEKALGKIFSSQRSIKIAKRAAEKVNPELWQDAVAELFRSEMESAAKVAQGAGGKVLNRPGKYVSRMWDLSSQRKMKEATKGMKDGAGKPLYTTISDFFDVMQKASIGQGKESATQPRQQMKKNLEGVYGSVSSASMNLRQVASDYFFSSGKEKAFNKNAKKLLELMQTPEGVDLIAKAKGIGTDAEQKIIATTTLLLMATQKNAGNIKDAIDLYQEE